MNADSEPPEFIRSAFIRVYQRRFILRFFAALVAQTARRFGVTLAGFARSSKNELAADER